jgi:hypothetical protein
MTEDAVRTLLEDMLHARADLAGLAVQRLRCVWLEIPESAAEAPSRVRDVRVWRAELWGGMRGALLTLDARSGDVLRLEYQ